MNSPALCERAITAIKKHQENLVSVENEIKTSCKKLKKSIEKVLTTRLREGFPNAKFTDLDWIVSVEAGCMTNEWKPEILFSSVAGYELSKEGYWFEDTILKFEKVHPPVRTKEFLSFLRELSEELGVKCVMIRTEPSYYKKSKVLSEAQYEVV